MEVLKIVLRYLHLLLLPVFFVAHHFFVNYRSVSLEEAFLLLAYHAAVAAVACVLILLFVKNFSTAALICTSTMIFMLFYGSAQDLMFSGSTIHIGIIHLILVGSFLLLMMFFSYLRRRWRKVQDQKIHYFLSLLFGFWTLAEIVKLVPLEKKFNTHFEYANFRSPDRENKPSIYLLLLDGYPRHDALNKIFGYDNSNFIQKLSERGFVLDSHSRSNYDLTQFSVASSLTMDYLPIPVGVRNEDYSLATTRINNAPLWNFLKKEGYNTVNYSIFRVDDMAPIPNAYLRDYNREYFKRTFPGRLYSDIYRLVQSKKSSTESDEEDLLQNLKYNEARTQQILRHTKTAGPEFVYLHLMMPHFPYYYDSIGRPVESRKLMNEEQFTGYLNYTNRTILKIIDKISGLPGEKVIFLFSDHGHREGTFPRELYFDNISAIYSSDSSIKIRGRSTNINQLRSLFNQALNQDLPFLKDSSTYLTQ